MPSDRGTVFAEVLRARLGDKAAEQAPAILLDLLRRYYALVHLGEIPAAHRARSVVVRIAAELETDAAAAIERQYAFHHNTGAIARADIPRNREDQ